MIKTAGNHILNMFKLKIQEAQQSFIKQNWFWILLVSQLTVQSTIHAVYVLPGSHKPVILPLSVIKIQFQISWNYIQCGSYLNPYPYPNVVP